MMPYTACFDKIEALKKRLFRHKQQVSWLIHPGPLAVLLERFRL